MVKQNKQLIKQLQTA